MSTDNTQTDSEPQAGNQLLKLAIEFGPLLVFFITNSWKGIFWGTGLFVVATVISLVLSRMLFGKLATMPLVSGFFVITFGGLTLYLQDETLVQSDYCH